MYCLLPIWHSPMTHSLLTKVVFNSLRSLQMKQFIKSTHKGAVFLTGCGKLSSKYRYME
jgi:hypothetical protein